MSVCNLYTTPLSEVIPAFGVKCNQYADDTCIYLTIDKETSLQVQMNLAVCTQSIYEWLLHNLLAFNPDKSEACMFGISCRVQLLKSTIQDTVGCSLITLLDHIKSLSVTIDTSLTFYHHMRKICKTSFFHI